VNRSFQPFYLVRVARKGWGKTKNPKTGVFIKKIIIGLKIAIKLALGQYKEII